MLVITIAFSSCATTRSPIPSKYDLDRQFMRVNEITNLRVGRVKSGYLYNHAEVYNMIRNYQKAEQEKPEGHLNGNPLPMIYPLIKYASYYQLLKVDQQSLIVRGGQDNNYLLVLEEPKPSLMSHRKIRIVTSGFIIRAKKDFVAIGDNMFCRIERIYVIGDDEQAAAIKDQLLGKPKTFFPPKKKKHI